MIEDRYTRARAERASSLLSSGEIVLDNYDRLPLPKVPIRYGRFQGYSRECDWGGFDMDLRENSLLVLKKRFGDIPASMHWPDSIILATATIYPGYATITHESGAFDVDIKTADLEENYDAISFVNKALKEEEINVVVWRLEKAKVDLPEVIRIMNESAMIYASSVVYSPNEQQLVAAQVVTTSQDLLKAIKATLANNSSKSYVTVKARNDGVYLKSAKKGFTTIGKSLVDANAAGTVTILLHPLAGDPQQYNEEYFYIVDTANDLLGMFTQRLDLAIPWPVKPEWGEYLLAQGKDDGIVEDLPRIGVDFTGAIRVGKNDLKWQIIIDRGLKSKKIAI